MRILVIGGAGMLGHRMFMEVVKQFGPGHTACTVRKPSAHYARCSIFNSGTIFENIDVLDWQGVEKALSVYRPTWIINCVGLTLRKEDASKFEKCLEINSVLPHLLAKWGLRHSARVIHFSTDCVFSGDAGEYLEDDIPDAHDVYGRTKFLGELHYPNSLTLRLSIVGRELEGKTELIEWFLAQKGGGVKGYSQALYSGLTTNQAAKQAVRVIKEFPGLSGLYHISSEPISKYELLRIVNQIYSCQTQINEEPNYVTNKILNCDRYSHATGFKKPSWTEMILEMKREEGPHYEF